MIQPIVALKTSTPSTSDSNCAISLIKTTYTLISVTHHVHRKISLLLHRGRGASALVVFGAPWKKKD